MGDLFDYLDWRGDISFGNMPLCPVDALLLSILPYIRQEGLIPSSLTAEPVRLADAAQAYFSRPVAENKLNAAHHRLLRALAASDRFSSLRLIGARKTVDRREGLQFAAITVLLPGQNLFVAFEGTDDSLVGWQEDFRMTYECPVPAQLRAAEYLREVALLHPLRRIFVGGHSKGGNMAMYAALYCGEEFSHRIRAVYNNDGPGFCDGTISSPEYRAMRHRIHTYLPESSVVAVLLEHDDNHKIVKSTARGIFQHDPYTWQVQGADFVYAKERTAFGKDTEELIDRFVKGMSPERKRQLGEALFAVLESSNQATVSGIGNNKLQSARNMLRGYVGLDPELRQVLNQAILSLNRSRKEIRRERKDSLAENEKSS